MRSKGLLMAAGLAAVLMSASACGPKATGSAATGTTSPPPAQASGPAAAGTSAAGSAAAVPAASAAAGGGGTANVCSLMSSAQASAINHVTYGAAKTQHLEAGFDTCTYANTGQHASPVDIQPLTVQVITLSGCYAQLRQTEGPGTAVAGIGDAAFGYHIGLVVNDGGRCVDISGLTDAELNNDYSHDVAMAKIIITALG